MIFLTGVPFLRTEERSSSSLLIPGFSLMCGTAWQSTATAFSECFHSLRMAVYCSILSCRMQRESRELFVSEETVQQTLIMRTCFHCLLQSVRLRKSQKRKNARSRPKEFYNTGLRSGADEACVKWPLVCNTSLCCFVCSELV